MEAVRRSALELVDAHARGIAHGDLSVDCIFVDKDQNVHGVGWRADATGANLKSKSDDVASLGNILARLDPGTKRARTHAHMALTRRQAH